MARRLTMVVVAVGLMLGLGACDWAQFRAGPAHTGFNPVETAISTSNVSTLTERFSAPLSYVYGLEPVIANGDAFVASRNLHSAMGSGLEVFDAAGKTDCSGAPASCTPLWQTAGFGISAPPVVAYGVVYASSAGAVFPVGPISGLNAYDAAGKTDCAGTPTTCEPMWTYDTGSNVVGGAPTVTGGVAYVLGGSQLYAFDATGNTNCSGTPKVCEPLWTANLGTAGSSSPAVAGGMVYVTVDGSPDTLFAFDATGQANCSGTPKVCTPSWIGQMAAGSLSSPAVANGVLYVGDENHKLYAFDATGTSNCTGVPSRCQPLWTATTGSLIRSTPAVANGVVYVGSEKLYAFDATGQSGCSGTPKTCAPLWTAATGQGSAQSPSVANGVVYVMGGTGLYAFDAAGVLDCAGTPVSCAPLWSVSQGFDEEDPTASPTIANGLLYAPAFNTQGGGFGGELLAFGLPQSS